MTRSDALPPVFAHGGATGSCFIGRRDVFGLLDDWCEGGRLLVLEAPGGLGKTVLVRRWLDARWSTDAPSFDGLLWFSFYESGTTFDGFLHHALAYMRGEDPAAGSHREREELLAELVGAIGERRILFVLDGVERTLVAYNRIDAPQIDDTRWARESEDALARLCAFVDPRDAKALEALVTRSGARAILTTRLVPTELRENPALSRALKVVPLEGLPDAEALELLRTLGVHGEDGPLLAAIRDLGHHSLVLRVVGSAVAASPRWRGDLVAWHRAAGSGSPLRPADGLVMAVEELPPEVARLLERLSAFRYAVPRAAVVAASGFDLTDPLHEERLNEALDLLRDRGLLLGDDERDTYDLHPIVRSTAYQRLRGSERQSTMEAVRGYFESLPAENLDRVRDVADLTRTIAIFDTLVCAARFDDANDLYVERLQDPLDELSAYGTIIAVLTALFPKGLREPPALSHAYAQSARITELGNALAMAERDNEAKWLRQMAIEFDIATGKVRDVGVSLINYGLSLEAEDKLSAAAAAYDWVERLGEAGGDIRCLAMAAKYKALLLADIGDIAGARAAAKRRREIDHPIENDLPLITMAELDLALMAGDDPSEALSEVWRVVKKHGSRVDRKRAHLYEGDVHLKAGDATQAEAAYAKAIRLARKTETDTGLPMARRALALARGGRVRAARTQIKSTLQQDSSLLDSLLSANEAAGLESLTLGPFDEPESSGDLMDLLRQGSFPKLRCLAICPDEDDLYGWRESFSLGDLTGLASSAPRLERLKLRGADLTLGALDFPELRTFVLQTSIDGPVSARLAEATLPRLERLDLWLGLDASIEELRWIASPLLPSRFPYLRFLGLRNAKIANEIVRELPSWSVLRQLHTLELSLGTLNDEGGERLLRNASSFSLLEHLGVTHNFLGRELCERLVAALPHAVVALQRGAEDSESADPMW